MGARDCTPTPAGDSDESKEPNTVTLDDLRWELAAYLYFCATVLRFFDEALSEETLSEAERSGALDVLARARQSFAVNPGLAWGIVSSFRKMSDLNPVDSPRSVG